MAALRSQGADVRVIGPKGFAKASIGHDPRWIGRAKAMMPKAIYEILEIGYNLPALFRLSRAVREFRPDIIYERYTLYLFTGAIAKRWYGLPLLMEVNAPLMRERAAFGGLGLKKLARRLEDWTWRKADFILPVTAVLAEDLRKAGVPDERICIIPNGIDTARFADAPAPDAAKQTLGLAGRIVVGFVGFMRPWHGLDAVIQWLAAAATRKDVHALIVGDGPAKADLEAQTIRLGLSQRVTFTGILDRDRIVATMAAFDIALQPASVAYASPLKLFEYMALGKAIVAPDQTNIREVLAADVSALLFDRSARAAMTQALDLLSNDAALRARLGAAARETIVTRDFTWEGNARRVLALAQRCLQGSPSETDKAAALRAGQ